MKPKSIPYSFVFDHLIPLEIIVKPMFGMKAIYIEEKILLILKKSEKSPESNGVWVATHKEYHESLKTELSLQTISSATKNKETMEWQLIRESDDHFEEMVIKVCELIKQKDVRIGRVPKTKKPKKK